MSSNGTWGQQRPLLRVARYAAKWQNQRCRKGSLWVSAGKGRLGRSIRSGLSRDRLLLLSK
jgi:hypothetical protein